MSAPAAMLQAVAEGRVDWCDTAPEVTERAVRYAEDRLASGLPTGTDGSYAALAHPRFRVGGKQVFGDDHRELAKARDEGLVELGDPVEGGSPVDRAVVLTGAGWAVLEEAMG